MGTMFLSETAPTMPHMGLPFKFNVRASYASWIKINDYLKYKFEFKFHLLRYLNYYFIINTLLK